MKLFESFREFRVFVFRYRATNKNAELEENKIRVIFDWENLWRGIRVSLGIILRLFYQQRKEIMIFRGFCRFREFRGIDLASFSSNLSENFSIIHLLLFCQRRGLMMIKLTWIRSFIFQTIVSPMKKEKLTIKVED